AHGLVKESGLPEWDEPQLPIATSGDLGRMPPMWDQEGVHEIYRAWRRLLESYGGDDRILVGEAWVAPPGRLVRDIPPDEMHQAFNFAYLVAGWNVAEQREAIDCSLAGAGSVGAVTTWVLSNHDVVRHSSRFGYSNMYPVHGGIGADDRQPDRAL